MDETTADIGSDADYDAINLFREKARQAAAETAENVERLDIRTAEESRGQGAYLFESGGRVYGHAEKDPGTKNLIADKMYELTSVTHYYSDISRDAVAKVVNGMITLGVQPVSCAMNLAVGDEDWFENTRRHQHLIMGWKDGCDQAGCVWGVTKVSVKKGIIAPGTFALSASAIGRRKLRQCLPMGPDSIEKGDIIIFLESSGIHSDGLKLADEIADKLPDGYLTKVYGESNYGTELLKPTHIYVKFVEMCIDQGIDIHYAVDITEGGWRRLMEAPQPFAYIVEAVPKIQPVFEFIQKHGPVPDEKAFGILNMGVGFALYVSGKDVQKIVRLGKFFDFGVMYGGHVDESAEKKVVIKPKGIEYSGLTLGVR